MATSLLSIRDETPRRATPDARSTGLPGLDELYGGTVPARTATIVVGPAFTGKAALAKTFLLAGLRAGVPGILVLTDTTARQMRQELTAMDPSFPDHEAAGLVRIVDAYSATVGADDDASASERVSSPADVEAIAHAIERAQRALRATHGEHRIVVLSLSTITAYAGADRTFRFLHALRGRARIEGAVSLFVAARSPAPDAAADLMESTMDFAVDLRVESTRRFVRVRGPGLPCLREWTEYRDTGGRLDVDACLGSGRIL